MKSKWTWKRVWLIVLILCVQVSTLSLGGFNDVVQAATKDQEIRINGMRIGNLSYSAENMMVNFKTNGSVGGFKLDNPSNITIDPGAGDVFIAKGQRANYTIRVADNPILADLAASGHATIEIGWNKLEWSAVCKTLCFGKNYQGTRATLTVNNTQWDKIEAYHGATGKFSRKITLQPNQVIDLKIEGIRDWNNKWTGVRGLYFKIEDKVRPTLSEVSFNGDGNERTNSAGQREMYIKQDEKVQLTYTFSEPVFPSTLTRNYNDHFLRHPFFTNQAGTGLPGQGEVQYLTNISYTAANIQRTSKNVTYQYSGGSYHNSGNLPAAPLITGTTNEPNPMDWSLHEKIEKAQMTDAAGNAAVIDYSIQMSQSSNPHVVNKTNNPFDSALTPDGQPGPGMSIIVDTVAPKYSKTGNGIQPEILTYSILNKNDRVEFTVNFTEEVMVANRPNWDVRQTYLLFNNGMKAYYISGQGTSQWKFSMRMEGLSSEETPLLKVIALTHDHKVEDENLNDTDTGVVEDYAGNKLVQPANFKGMHPVSDTDPDRSVLDSTIDWAGLVVDNTPPMILFEYDEQLGASDEFYGRDGSVTIKAMDPDLIVPALDPVEEDRYTTVPSKGVYRPSNITDGNPNASANGLVYYYWSRSAENPLASKSKDHFAALKRFSLTGKQPSQELYPGELTDFELSIANNMSNIIPVPAEATLPSGSGTWYLHTWTADMTWDSARELKQYEKRQEFIYAYPEIYQAWMDEINGNDSQKEFYANTKAMAEVGQYDDLEMWPLSDFKQDDSNWAYVAGEINLDNVAPTITFEGVNNNYSSNVQVKVLLSDEHSGIKEGFYTFVSKTADQGAEKQWEEMVLSNKGRQTLSTSLAVPEDGEYTLYIKAVDQTGIEAISVLGQTIVVDSTSNVQAAFSPEVDETYVRAQDVVFHLSGMLPKDSSIKYVWSQSSLRPSDIGEYRTALVDTQVTGQSSNDADAGGDGTDAGGDGIDAGGDGIDAGGDGIDAGGDGTDAGGDGTDAGGDGTDAGGDGTDAGGEGTDTGSDGQSTVYDHNFTIPMDDRMHGLHYLHVYVEDEAQTREYTFMQGYYWDNVAPTVTFNRSGSSFARSSQEVTATVTETLSPIGLIKKYQWLREDLEAPDYSDAGWLEWPENSTMVVTNEELEQGQSAFYRLYILAEDGVGNASVTASGLFEVNKTVVSTAPTGGSSELIALFSDEENNHMAVMRLLLNAEDKSGYQYSVSTNGGTKWTTWKPYTNFISVKTTTNIPENISFQVKFRKEGTEIGDPVLFYPENVDTTEPIFVLASIDSLRKVNADIGVEISLDADTGVKVTPAAGNPMTPQRIGNSNAFKVTKNGVYAFDIVDLSNPLRKDQVIISVSQIDDVAPTGEVELVVGQSSNKSVLAKLTTNEPVRITNNNGKSLMTITENGTYQFEFEDEAGNRGSAPVTVGSIDRTPPNVRIVKSYRYGNGANEVFGTVVDGDDNVIAASGVVLTVEKVPGSEEFTMVKGSRSVTLKQNGKVSFTVSDAAGNTTTVSENIDFIIPSKALTPEAITYSYVDADGNELAEAQLVEIDGKKYARGQVKLTATGSTAANNLVFSGTQPVKEGNVYKNLISDGSGRYNYERLFNTNGQLTLAVSDMLGNVSKFTAKIEGLDNTAPELKVSRPVVTIEQNKANFDFIRDLGGYSVSDNLSKASDIKVSITGLDLTTLGKQRVTYTAVDQVGNTSTAVQEVIVVDHAGMQLFANGILISATASDMALFNTNKLTIDVRNFNAMIVDGTVQLNEVGTYDLFYYSGIFREGQMKYIATSITYEELMETDFTVEFPTQGWYTIVVRNQERERIYATFFISKFQ